MADYTQQLHETLAAAAGLRSAAPENLSNDIKAATVQLDRLFKQASLAIPGLSQILFSSPEDQVRQLAAVELRKLVNKSKNKTWLKVGADARTQIKAQLLQHLSSGSEKNLQAAQGASRVVAAISRVELPQGQWPELLPWVWSTASAADVNQKEIGLYVLFTLVDTFTDSAGGNAFSQHVPQLYGLLSTTLSNPASLKARVLAVRVLGRMVDYIDVKDSQDVQAMQAMVPSVLQVCQQALQEDDDVSIKHVFDVMDTLSFSDAPILSNNLPDLIHFFLQAGANQAFSPEARLAPLNCLLFLVKYKKSKIQSLNLTKPILEGLLPIGAEEEPEDYDEDAPARVAFRIIDTLANNLPPQTVVDPLIQLCQQFATSPNAGLRKAAIMAFGVTFEGCSLYIINLMDQLWPFVDQCLVDQDLSVRKAACMSLTFMCDVIGEACAKRHAQLLPVLFELVNHEATRRHAINALDSLLETLGKDIIPYLPTLMERLLTLLPIVELGAKPSVVGAIGSAAHASKAAFTPYFQTTMQQLVPFLRLTEEGEQLELRGVTQDTVGTLAEAVGKEAYAPYFEEVLNLAFEGTKAEGSNMRECSFIYFAVISRVYKEDFAQFLPAIVPLLLASLYQDDKSENAAVLAAADGFESHKDSASTNADEDEAFEDLDDEDLEEALLGINSALSREKEMAADALDELFENTKIHFMPYMEKSIHGFVQLFDHYNENLRKAGLTSALNFIATANKLSNPPKWTPGLNSAPLIPEVQRLVDVVIPSVLEAWDEEDDRDVATALCDTFSSVIMDVGPRLLTPKQLETLCKLVLDILERRSKVQVEDEDDEGVVIDQQSEWDAHLIRGAGDLCSSLAIAVGADFAPAFNSFLPALAQYMDPKRQPSERSSAVGAVAEAINGLKSGVTNFTEDLFRLLMAGLQDADLDVRSNASFAMGSLVFQTEKDLSSQYLTILGALEPLFDRATNTDDSNQACDNASGAVARLILKNSAALPMAQVIPTFLAVLPIRQDYVENTKVFEALLHILQQGLGNGHEREIFNVMGQVLAAQREAGPDEKPLTEEMEKTVLDFLRQLSSSDLQASGLQAFVV